jgi:hypothetical protein
MVRNGLEFGKNPAPHPTGPLWQAVVNEAIQKQKPDYDSRAFVKMLGLNLSRPPGDHQPGQGEQQDSAGSAAEATPLRRRSGGSRRRGGRLVR